MDDQFWSEDCEKMRQRPRSWKFEKNWRRMEIAREKEKIEASEKVRKKELIKEIKSEIDTVNDN